ncbi:MAG: molybdenum cofactor guanylyltransferase [Nitrospinota bacterium]|nr:molybdenum cofactor guanylyltransferase [Nitrospinota bacterium]
MSAPSGRIDFPAAILAGGKSRRMGRDKAFLPMEGRPAVSRVADSLKGIFSDVFVVANDPPPYEALGFRVVVDILEGNDSLGGLHAAVASVGGGHVFVTGCDMPSLQAPLLKGLASQAEGWDVVVPIVRDFSEPLCAVYGSDCEAPIRSRIEAGELKMIGFYTDVRVKRVEEAEWRPWDPDALSFRNLNTPGEYEEAAGGN